MRLEKEIKILFDYETPIEDLIIELQDLISKYKYIKISETGYIYVRAKE